MAEAAFSAFLIRVLSEKAASLLLPQFQRVLGGDVRRDLSKLQSILSTVQAVLGDAEEKQVKDKALKQWLSNLKDAAYDADDILDDLDSRVLRREAAGNNKVRRFFSSGCPLVFSVGMGQRVRGVVQRFNDIADERSKFHLSPADYGSSSGTTAAVSRETHSFVVESGVIGRQEDVSRIVEILVNLNNGNITSSVSVLPIVGMGGLGKTTLAQMVYNEQRVVERFELRLWVCVSDEFNVKKLIKAIIESGNGKCDDKTMDSLQRSLREMLATKRYLLVLDDVWNEDPIKWEELAILLSSGSRGSAVIVTTRSERASSIMEPLQTFHLTHLSLEDCWALFRNRAFAEGTEERHPNLVEIGRAIVKKLGGLPLAVKTVGSLMRFKTDESQWLSVLQSEIWNIAAGEKDILPALRLSYNHLPSHLKQCFAYCAIFPKDSVLEKEVLIQLWMANGFIPSQGRMELEAKGAEIFNELASRFFLQDVEEVGKPSTRQDICTTATCKMHDLIHDLARDIMGSEYCLIDSNMDSNEQLNQIHTGTTRHVTLGWGLPSKTMTQVICKSSKTIRTVFALRNEGIAVRRDMWLKLKSARVLALHRVCVMNVRLFSFPKDKLKHLRYLDLSYTDIKTLPESISCLFHLQTLKLEGCWNLRQLPSGIGDISSLRHLYTDGCDGLTCMPRGMGKLSSLQTLSMYMVGRTAGSGSIIELKELNIGGKLHLRNLENVRSAVDATGVHLNSKQSIRDLVLSWGRKSLEDHFTNNGSEVIEVLQPHHNLRNLTINSFGGICFPNWLVNGDQVLLPNLVEISLFNCRKCKHLPPFGQLPSLEVLELDRLEAVECMGGGNSALYGNGGSSVVGLFPSLKELRLSGMTNLEEWTTLDMGATGSLAFFPRLIKLEINECPKLKTMPGLLPCVEYLYVRGCPLLLPEKGFFPTMKSLRDLHLMKCDKLTLLLEEEHTGGPLTSTSSTLRKLRIERCKSLMFSAPSVGFWKNLGTSLEDLSFDSCGGLVSLPEELLCCLGSVKKLEIRFCKNLAAGSSSSLQSCRGGGGGGGGGEVGLQLQHLTSLEDLSIERCEKLAGVPLEGLQRLTALTRLSITAREGQEALPNSPPCLLVLRIGYCPNLESLPPERIACLTALQELRIQDCPKLTCLPQGLGSLTHLRILSIEYCDNLTSLPDGLEGLAQLEDLTIARCPKLNSLPQGLQQRLPSLRRLFIDDCPSLQRQYGEAGREGWHLVSSIPIRHIHRRHGRWSLHFCD